LKLTTFPLTAAPDAFFNVAVTVAGDAVVTVEDDKPTVSVGVFVVPVPLPLPLPLPLPEFAPSWPPALQPAKATTTEITAVNFSHLFIFWTPGNSMFNLNARPIGR
jgi:hypothetical protein